MNPITLGRRLRLALLLLALYPAAARADQLLLKNGRTMEGIIRGEDAVEVTLDFGYGTTTLQKADIASIRRSTPKQRRALERRLLGVAAKSGSIAAPAGAEELSRLLEAARRGREEAQDARREREQILDEQAELAEQARELRGRQPRLAAALGSANPNNRRDYNSLVGEVNAVNAGLSANAYQVEEAGRKLEAGEAALGKYLGDYSALRRYSAANLQRLRAGAPDEAAKVFYEDAARELAEMAAEFNKQAVPSRRVGAHLIVDVVFNGKVTVPLLVDTGASQTVISPEVAAEVGLEGGEVVHSTVADGRQVEGRLIVVDSLAVGDARVEKTPVIVIAAPGPDAKGLLGMSFLKNFMVQLDLPNSKLILESLAPAAPAKR
ncbi:MAG: retroviral-like aspartic protease family protein [Elusimicrobia bacterium]|nr:retroviral-like aspartic protease family protein [Elusimicrobiota bacterium]